MCARVRARVQMKFRQWFNFFWRLYGKNDIAKTEGTHTYIATMASIHLNKNATYFVGDLNDIEIEYVGMPLGEWETEGGSGTYRVISELYADKFPERLSCPSGKIGVVKFWDAPECDMDYMMEHGCVWKLDKHDARIGMVDGELVLMEILCSISSRDIFKVRTWEEDSDSDEEDEDDSNSESEDDDGYATDSSGEEYEPSSSCASESDSDMEDEDEDGSEGESASEGGIDQILRVAGKLLSLCDDDYEKAKEMLKHAATMM